MKISVITAAYKSGGTIADAIKSLLAQTYKDVEHIIIDGGSVDGTRDIVASFGDKISRFVSEPDNGIYDAMNKGIKLATGDIVGVLNSDDMYADKNALARVAAAFENPEVDVCYGDLVYVSPVNIDKPVRVWKSSPYAPGCFLSGWVPPHPTFFARRPVYTKHGGFDLSFPLAADFELMLRFLHCYKLKSVYIPATIMKMRLGGATNKNAGNVLRQNIEIFKAGRKNGVPLRWRFFIGKLYDRLLQYIRADNICG
ncbi:MAG: glycosyltransferase family 2 protein [Elusimicrobia bacterium]|nr:glycosyltransferase family 2 protein [Elusimicrobiota bacterium]